MALVDMNLHLKWFLKPMLFLYLARHSRKWTRVITKLSATCNFTELKPSFQTGKTLIQVDLDPARFYRAYIPDIPILADLTITVNRLHRKICRTLSKNSAVSC